MESKGRGTGCIGWKKENRRQENRVREQGKGRGTEVRDTEQWIGNGDRRRGKGTRGRGNIHYYMGEETRTGNRDGMTGRGQSDKGQGIF